MTDQAGEDRMKPGATSGSGADRHAANAQGDDTGDENEQIRARAYERWLARGGEGGDEREDWFEAEREYRERAHARQASATRPANDTRSLESETRQDPRKR